MELFTIIEDAFAITTMRGVHRQAKVYRRGENVFVGYGGGFVRLMPHGCTTIPTMKWLEIEGDGIVKTGISAPKVNL